jgi:hypothetical protein
LAQPSHEQVMPLEENLRTVAFVAKCLADENRLNILLCINHGKIFMSREQYQSDQYKALGLPPAPAVMVEDEIAGQGPGITEEGLEAVIRRHLGLPPVNP